MGIITGGRVIEPSTTNPGTKPRIHWAEGTPTDTNIGAIATPTNGMLAGNVTNGQVFERIAGVWTRIDTL
jgi:hypothetical protein